MPTSPGSEAPNSSSVYDYTSVDSVFEMIILGSGTLLAGMEGSPEKARDFTDKQ